MLQNVDNEQRREWMGILARAPLALLEAWFVKQAPTPFTWLRAPETGLVMVRARAGGTGDKFNLGEMTVTRCALRVGADASRAAVGVAYVPGRSHRRAELAALADALLQQPGMRATALAELVAPLRTRLEAEAARMQRKAQATRVEFFTVAREGGA